MRDKRRHNWIQRWSEQGRQARRHAKHNQGTAPAAATTSPVEQPAAPGQAPASPASRPVELQASAIHPQPLQQPQEPEQLRLRSSLSAVWSELQSRAGSTDFVALLQQVFGPGRESTAQALADHLAAGDQLGLHVELLSGSVMAGAMGAYAAAGPDRQPTIYINADWLQGASDADLRLVLLEEIGHRFDTVMNGGVDTAGDEGQSFAALFSGQPLSADQRAAIANENDSATLTINGVQVAVEEATQGAITSSTLGATTTTQALSATETASISLTITYNGRNNNGVDFLVAAYNGTNLIGWTVYNRSSLADAGNNSNTSTIALTFNLARFNPNFSSGGLTIRVWQGTAGGATSVGTGSDTSPALTSGTTSSVPFSPNTTTVATTDQTLSGFVTTSSAGSSNSAASSTWTNTTVDTTAPTITISDNVAGTAKIGDTVTFTFTFSEAVTGFDATKVTVGNGTKGTFTAVSSTVYTLLVTPTASSSGNVTVDVSTTAVTDTAGNQATVPARFLQAFDTLAPAAPTLSLAADTGTSTSDRITNNATINVAGLESSATWEYSTNSGTNWTSGSGSSFSVTAGSYSLGQVRVRQTDQAGNLGAANTSFAAFTVDTTASAPAVALATDSGVAGDKITNVGTLSVTGTETGALVEYSANGTSGWSSSAPSLSQGSNTVYVRQTDGAGNISASTAFSFTYDNQAAAPTITAVTDDVLPVTGNVANGGYTNDTNLQISGNAEANSTVTLYNGASVIGTATANGAGAWSINSGLLTDGTQYSFTAIAVDAAGNTSAASAAYVVNVDTGPPSAVTLTLGTGIADGATATEATAATGAVSIVAPTGSTVSVSFSRSQGGSVTKNLIGSGTAQAVVLSSADLLNLGDGVINVAAVATDAAGNSSTAATTAFTLDTAAPVAAALALQADSGSSNRDGITSNATVLVSQLEANTTWQVSTNSGSSWSTGSGSSFSLAPGSYNAGQVQVRQIDLAGNVSAVAANSQAWVVDTTAPQFLSSGVAAAINESSGANQLIYTPQMAATEALTGGVLRYAISGGDAAGFSVSTFNGAVRLLANPDYETKPNYNFTLAATDVAGNASSQTVTLAITDLDEVAPNTPQINVVTGDDRINASEAGSTVVVSGSAEAGSTVRVTWGANPARSTTATDGVWSVSFSASEVPAKGSSTISATATDAAGNVSTLGSRTVVVDRVAPNRPVLNTVASDNRINAAEAAAGIVLSGTAEAGSLISATLAGVSRTATAAANGTWSLTYGSAQLPADGWASLTVTSSDAAGNVSSAATRQLLVDTTAPQTQTLQAVAGDNRINAAEAAAGIQFSGTTEAGAVVQVRWDGSSMGTAVADAQGLWALNLAAAALPADGDRNLLISASDAAGNVSASLSRSINLDRLAPSTPTINSVGNGDVVNAAVAAAGVLVNGTAETGSQISVQWGNLLRTTSADADGNWSLLYGTSQLPGDGVALISVSSRDSAGNISSLGSRSVLVDTTPSLTAVSSLRLSADTGANNNDFITSQAQQTLSGVLSASLQSGETVQISLDGGSQWSSATAGADLQSFSLPINLSASGTIQARVLDAAGNAGAVTSQAYRLDSSASGNGVSSLAISADSGVQGDRLTNVSLQTIRGQLNAPLQAGESVQFRRQLSDGSWSNWGTATSSLNSQAFLFSTSLREGANGFDVRYVDSAGNGGQASNLNVTLDSTAPQVSAITVNGAGLNGSWQAGDLATIQVRFSEAINVTGTPALKVMVGAQSVATTYSSASGSDLTFTTAISAEAAATNPIISIAPGSLDLFNATISDAAGNNALVAISNQLIGSDSADVINGGAQTDVITGAAGADQLSGGAAADLFVYRSAADSNLGSNGAGYDRITDFQLGVDQLQLGNQSPISSFTAMGSISDLSTNAISGLLTTSSFATPGFSASFQVGLDNFLAVNDSNAGFSDVDDLLVAIGSQSSSPL